MEPKSIHWGEHPWEEIRRIAEAGALVVAPFGSAEQHGPMLPVDTDIRIAEKVSTEGATLATERYGVPVLVLPTVPFGMALHHMRFAGTVSLQPETYINVAAEVLGSVLTHGFRKIAVISGHGGNMPGLQLGIRKTLQAVGEPVRIALFQGWNDREFARMRARVFEGVPSEGQPGIHAALTETAGTLADRPHLVRRERMVRPTMKLSPAIPDWSWTTDQLSETGAFGDPSLATAEVGQKLWEAWAESVALFIKRLWETE